MKKSIVIIICVALAIPTLASAGIKRLDISPMALINLDETLDSDSRLLGGAVAADLYFSRHFAIRTSVGYVRNLYNTSVSRIDRLFDGLQPVEGDSYSFRLSIAPYAEAHVGGFRPYVTISGGVGYLDNSGEVADIGAPQSQVISNSRYISSSSRTGSYYDFTGAIGIKVLVYSNISLFGEVSHRVYSSLDSDSFNTVDGSFSQVPFGFNDYKTILSAGASYSFNFAGE